MAADAPAPGFEAYATESVPQAPVGAPGKDGRLELAFESADEGRSRLVRDFARVPFHVSGTLDCDPHPEAATVYVQSPTGGIAQGDRHEIEIAARRGAVGHVSTQSATKVQTMERNYAAADVGLSVGAGGHLEYLPEPTILNAGARFCRDATLTVASDATAIVGEVIVPGRLARGERFDFERFSSRLRVRTPEGLRFEDATELHPGADDRRATGNPTAPGVLGEHAVYGTLYVVAPDGARLGGDPAGIERLADAIHDRIDDGDAHAGATTLPNHAGVLARGLDETTEPVTEALRAGWDEARRALFDVPAPEARTH